MREFCSITITGLYRSKGPSGIFDAVSAYDHHISMARVLARMPEEGLKNMLTTHISLHASSSLSACEPERRWNHTNPQYTVIATNNKVQYSCDLLITFFLPR